MAVVADPGRHLRQPGLGGQVAIDLALVDLLAGQRDLGVAPETLRKAVRQAEADSGRRGELLTSQEREEIKALRREVKDLRRANEILKSASVFFAKELDPDRTK